MKAIIILIHKKGVKNMCPPSRAYIHTKGKIDEYRSNNDWNRPIDLKTWAEADGDTPLEIQVAGHMAGEIGKGQSMASADYLARINRGSSNSSNR
jgi:hypothetical protein